MVVLRIVMARDTLVLHGVGHAGIKTICNIGGKSLKILKFSPIHHTCACVLIVTQVLGSQLFTINSLHLEIEQDV